MKEEGEEVAADEYLASSSRLTVKQFFTGRKHNCSGIIVIAKGPVGHKNAGIIVIAKEPVGHKNTRIIVIAKEPVGHKNTRIIVITKEPVRLDPYGTYITILCPPGSTLMSHLCAQVRRLFCKNWS